MIKNATIFKVNQTGLTTNQPKFEGVDIDHVHSRTMANTDNGYHVREGGAA